MDIKIYEKRKIVCLRCMEMNAERNGGRLSDYHRKKLLDENLAHCPNYKGKNEFVGIPKDCPSLFEHQILKQNDPNPNNPDDWEVDGNGFVVPNIMRKQNGVETI